MHNYINFGNFIRAKRNEQNVSLRYTALQIGIAPVYLSDIENGKKTNPSKEIMQKLIDFLLLDKKETELFYDLHAKANGAISQDLPEYIMENDIVRMALRSARDKHATESDWKKFIDELK